LLTLAHPPILELFDLVGVTTLGGAGRRSLGDWALWLLLCRLILAAYDAGEAGCDGAACMESVMERV
jgi:hypothetical protein